jgi:hypothetical protein
MISSLSKLVLTLPLLGFFAATPSTPSYQLNSYGFGSGGTANSSTPTYSLEGITGEISGSPSSTTTYKLNPGFIHTQQINVPAVTFTNPIGYYDKLKFVIVQPNDPSDTTYALQISTTSDFSSNINYVKSDLTIGGTLTSGDYQTYAVWGGASGANIIGLSPNTTYYLRAKASQGTSESTYGPSSSASTQGQTLSFCMYTGANCAAGGSSISFSNVLPATITDSPNNIGVDFATNASFGGNVYIYGSNGGLHSSSVNYTIVSATADLGSVNEGFGAQISTAGQSSGGPFAKVSPYDGTSNNVGAITTNARTLLSTAGPVVGGTSSVKLKLLAAGSALAATDYAETMTLIAASSF